MSVESPESRTLWQALAPLTPPAALMSETARPTPETAGRPEEGEVAGQRQDAADVERVGAAGPSRALVVGERGCGLRRGLVGRGSGARALVVAGVCFGVAIVAARDQGQPQGCAQSDRGRQPPEPPGGGGGSIHVVNLSSRECTSPRPGSPNTTGLNTATVISARMAAPPRTLSLANRYVNAPHGSEHDAFGLGEDYSHPRLSHVRAAATSTSSGATSSAGSRSATGISRIRSSRSATPTSSRPPAAVMAARWASGSTSPSATPDEGQPALDHHDGDRAGRDAPAERRRERDGGEPVEHRLEQDLVGSVAEPVVERRRGS